MLTAWTLSPRRAPMRTGSAISSKASRRTSIASTRVGARAVHVSARELPPLVAAHRCARTGPCRTSSRDERVAAALARSRGMVDWKYDVRRRVAGVDSLGHLRLVLVGDHDEAPVARELKHLAPPAGIWLDRAPSARARMAAQAIRLAHATRDDHSAGPSRSDQTVMRPPARVATAPQRPRTVRTRLHPAVLAHVPQRGRRACGVDARAPGDIGRRSELMIERSPDAIAQRSHEGQTLRLRLQPR